MKCVVLAYHSMGCAAIDELINARSEEHTSELQSQ